MDVLFVIVLSNVHYFFIPDVACFFFFCSLINFDATWSFGVFICYDINAWRWFNCVRASNNLFEICLLLLGMVNHCFEKCFCFGFKVF